MAATLATLGTLEFQVLGPEPSKWSVRKRYNFVEHKRLEGKPSMQQVGGEMDVLSLDIRLHSHLVDVTEALQALRNLADAQRAEDLVLGSEYLGRWIIASLSEDIGKLAFSGDDVQRIYTDLKLQLKEWLSEEPPNASQIGAAVGFAIFV